MITMAYDIPHGDRQLIGLPKWAQDWTQSSYSVEAKAGADFPVLAQAENEAQIKLMMREMLADRFKLRLHVETRQESLLIMTVERGSLKVKEVEAAEPPARGRINAALGDRGGRMIAEKGTMSDLASTVSLFLRQDVIDQTGVTGSYDFNLRWDAPRVEGAPTPAASLGDEGIGLFLSTLREELGLRFSKGMGPVRYWVVDSVEPPTEN
jgi:uncharacterized protein (TIGR03435 family)